MLIAFCQIIACLPLFPHICQHSPQRSYSDILSEYRPFWTGKHERSPFIGIYDLRASDDLFIKGSSFIDIPDRFLRLILKYRIKYIVNILKIIIEGISVDLTYFTDILLP